MTDVYNRQHDSPVPVQLVTTDQHQQTLLTLTDFQQQWLHSTAFECKPGAIVLLPDATGSLALVYCCMSTLDDVATVAKLARQLPQGHYVFELEHELSETQYFNYALYWGLGCYRYDRYLSSVKPPVSPTLVLKPSVNFSLLQDVLDSICLGQDLINTPTEDFTPADLVEACQSVAEQFNASIELIQGDDLLDKGFPLVHAVGRASVNPPCLIDLRWGNLDAPSVTLVGKGVCYDTGGLSLKPTSNMKSMKKDMGGAASALVLARLIMSQQLNINLRVLIPAVENSVSGNSIRPGDVVISRKGISVEITNTDAEGRLILADALTYAEESKPDFLLDFATLTGAARVAFGADITPVFANDPADARAMCQHAATYQELTWPMPVHQPYRHLLKSDIADIANSGTTPFAGAITAAVFLQNFVDDDSRWWHFDLYCTISDNFSGLGKGARIPVIVGIFDYLKDQLQVLQT